MPDNKHFLETVDYMLNLLGQTHDGNKHYVVGDLGPELIDFKPRSNKDKSKPEPIADNDDWWKWGKHA